MNRFTRSTFRLNATAQRHGSVFILVLAILSVLVLLGLTFSFATKVELLASRNWSDAVQARMATVSGLPPLQENTHSPRVGLAEVAMQSATAANEGLSPVRLRLAPEELPLDPLTPLPTPYTLGNATLMANTLPGADTELLATDNPSKVLALAYFSDPAAQLNINAVLPVREQGADRTRANAGRNTWENGVPPLPLTVDALSRFIANAFQRHGIQNVDPQALAVAIAQRRYGADGMPGRAGIDDNANGPQVDAATDGIDNDLDGLTDEPRERLLSSGHDKIDNDRDGQIDETDESIAGDGLDNDFDGQIDEPDEAVDDPREFNLDPRLIARGDDRPFQSVAELLTLPGMTPEAYRALEPYLTVFSVSYAAFADTESFEADRARGWPQVDPNTASVELIFDVLRLRYPESPEGMLAQFAVNLVDRRDTDDVPTAFELGGKTYYGQELTPRINEVCPNVASDETQGDDGQYVELFNPYQRPLDLTGWQLRGAGPAIPLGGSLPPGGIMVLTDDFDGANDTEHGYADGATFYDLFHQVPATAQRQIKEYPELSLPDEAGEIQLADNRGKVVDVFRWSDGRWTGAPMSFQRTDPRLNAAEHRLASPLKLNPGQEEGVQSVRLQEQLQNTPFHSALDVMLVSCAWAGSSQLSDDMQAQPWALPDLSSDPEEGFDLRLVDCFAVGAELPAAAPARRLEMSADEQTAWRDHNQETMLELMDGMSPFPEAPRVAVRHGLINLNTAPAAVLAALPGIEPDLLSRIEFARRPSADPLAQPRALDVARREYWRPLDPFATPRWQNLSEFLLDETVWQDRPLYDRLDEAYPFWQLLTAHSQSLEIVTVNRLPDQPLNPDPTAPQPSTIKARRMLAGDRGTVETIDFQFLQPALALVGDPDLRYAAPLSDGSSIVPDLLAAHREAQAAAGDRAGNVPSQSSAVRRLAER